MPSAGSSSQAPPIRCHGTAESSGELQCRGNWIASDYYDDERSRESFTDDGWLKTGDVATVNERGFVRLVDRTKDLIKSGGEWISSVELENELMAHPKIAEAAVIGVAHERWGEAPLACVVKAADGQDLTEDDVLGVPRGQDRQVADAEGRRVDRRGPQDQRRQVLEEDPARRVRDDADVLTTRWVPRSGPRRLAFGRSLCQRQYSMPMSRVLRSALLGAAVLSTVAVTSCGDDSNAESDAAHHRRVGQWIDDGRATRR